MPVKITGTNFDQATQIHVLLNKREVLLDKPRGDSASSLTFRIPEDLPLGRYSVRVAFDLNTGPQPPKGVPVPSQNDQLRVVSDTAEKVKVSGIHPVVGYPSSGRLTLRILGEGFSLVDKDNQLIRTDGGAVDVTWVDELPSQIKEGDRKVYGHVHDTRQLDFSNLPLAEHMGKLKFQVRVGDVISEPAQVTFARVPRGVPWLVALVVVVLLAAMVYIPVTWKLHRHKVGDRSFRAWETFLLDQQTDTLSLSKFQLYVWTGVAVFSYSYLTITRSLVQGVFEFAPIPDGLPAIIGISAGTTALAAGVTAARGSKGAGEEQPSFADLITSGGVVVAERFQFLVWTVLGALAFLFVVVFSDPAVIENLPKIPDGFLYLMGISSAGYLGGKMTRKAGPVIDTVVAQQGTVVIDIQGQNLSRQATFMIDDHEVTCDLLPLPANVSQAAPKKDATLEVIRRGSDSADSDFALALRLRLTDESAWLAQQRVSNPDLKVDAEWLKDLHRISVMNPDGQKAVVSFAIKPKT